MLIKVETVTGETISIEVTPSDTMEKLKSLVHGSYGLTYDGETLNDNLSVSNYSIPINSVLKLVHDPSIQICVQTTFNETTMLKVAPSDTIGDVKKNLMKYQRFTLKGKSLDDDRTFAHYKIKKDSTLKLTKYDSMKIFVKNSEEKSFPFYVCPSARIESLKPRIEDEMRVPVQQQRLLFLRKPLVDDKTFSEQNVAENSTIYLILGAEKTEPATKKSRVHDDETSMEIFIHIPNNVIIKLKVDPSITIGDMKNTLLQLQRFTLNGNSLDDHLTLEHYKINHNSTLRLIQHETKRDIAGTSSSS